MFCDVTGRRVLRLNSEKQLTTVVTLESFAPGGLAFHPDGRLTIRGYTPDMRYRTFGRTGEKVSVLGFGGMRWPVVGGDSREAHALVKSGHKALAMSCNVADEGQVRDMVAATIKEFGRLDAAFNNAGIQSPVTDTAELEAAEFDRVISIM